MRVFDPKFDLLVESEGQDVTNAFMDAVEQLTFSNSIGSLDQLKATLLNPRHELTRKKMIQPGNTIEIWTGWGGEVAFLGAVTLENWLGKFPTEGMPKININGLCGGSKLAARKEEELFMFSRPSDAVHIISEHHGFLTDVEQAGKRDDFAKEAGNSDWEFLMGLAGTVGFDFYVEWDPAKKIWVTHWHSQRQDQETTFRFRYDPDGQRSTLFNIDISFGIQYDNASQVVVYAWNGEEYVELKTEEEDGADVDTKNVGQPDLTTFPDEFVPLRIGIGGNAVDVLPNIPILDADTAYTYAKDLLERRKREFITAKGRLIGIEGLKARQVHTIEGLEQFSGEYFFTKVDHRIGSDGYWCDFIANKVLK